MSTYYLQRWPYFRRYGAITNTPYLNRKVDQTLDLMWVVVI